jgi:predicted permease
VSIVLIEAGLQTETRRRDIATKTFFSLVKNPLLVAPMLGVLVMASGGHLPAPLHTFLKLLGGAASPCALIALGLFLAGTPSGAATQRLSTAGILVGLKLIAQPLITWVLAGPLLGLPPATTHIAVVLAALPTGTGSFMLAEFYGREAGLTGRVVLVSTVLSVLTISIYLGVSGS